MAFTNLRNLFQSPNYVAGTAIADRSLAVADSVVTLIGADAVPASTPFDSTTDTVVLDVQLGDVMVTFDGSDPAASSVNGHRLYAGQAFTWSKTAANKARFIRATTTSARIHASEFSM